MGTVPTRFESAVVRTKTPDGTLFTMIDELEGKPWQIRLEIGKSGSAIRAWTHAFGEIVTLALKAGVPLEEIISAVSEITSDRITYDTNVAVRSGPDGFAYSLMKYRGHKYKEMNKILGMNDRRRRPPRLHGRSSA